MNDSKEKHIALFEKLVKLYSWDQKCLQLLCKLAKKGGNEYKESIETLEKQLQDVHRNDFTSSVDHNQSCQELFELAVSSPPLFEIFKTSPLFSISSPETIVTMAGFADVKPHSETMIKTQDIVLTRILNLILQEGRVEEKEILQDDLSRLITLLKYYPEILKLMCDVAKNDHWHNQMLTLERKIEGTDESSSNHLLSESTREIFRQSQSPTRKASPVNNLNIFLLEAPRFSSMLPEEVIALWEMRKQLPDANLDSKFTPTPRAEEESSTIAAKVLDSQSSEMFKTSESSLRLRIQIANHLLDRRKFAKLDALKHCWPEMAYLLMGVNHSELIEIEQYCTNSEDRDFEERLNVYTEDRKLVDFLHLKPLFRDIYPDEFSGFLKASQVVEERPLIEHQPQLNTIPDLSESFAPTYPKDILIDIQSSFSEYDRYTVNMTVGSENHSAEITLNWEKIDRLTEHIREAVQNPIVSERPVASEGATRAIAFHPESLKQALKELGTLLFDSIFEELRDHLLDIFSSGDNYRIIWEIRDSDVTRLPLETIYVPAPLRKHLALSHRYSMVRKIANILPSHPNSSHSQIRILAIFSNPTDTPKINLDKELDILLRSLKTSMSNHQIKLEILHGDQANPEKISDYLEQFQPHLLHFAGHGVYQQKLQEGGIILTNPDNTGDFFSSTDCASLLEGSSVKLVILNACDTGVASQNSAITGVAGALINSGIAAVIAAMRVIPDKAALMFTREFYRAIENGHDIETAVVKVRKSLYLKNFDWSAYALFAGETDLADLKLSL